MHKWRASERKADRWRQVKETVLDPSDNCLGLQKAGPIKELKYIAPVRSMKRAV